MAQDDQITVKDSEDIKNILVQIDLKNDRAQVISSFSAWEHLALLTEALGASIDECIEDGMDKEEVIAAVKEYYHQLIDSYNS